MMLRHSFDMNDEADAIEQAVNGALDDGLRTPDIATGKNGEKLVNTSEMGKEVIARI